MSSQTNTSVGTRTAPDSRSGQQEKPKRNPRLARNNVIVAKKNDGPAQVAPTPGGSRLRVADGPPGGSFKITEARLSNQGKIRRSCHAETEKRTEGSPAREPHTKNSCSGDIVDLIRSRYENFLREHRTKDVWGPFYAPAPPTQRPVEEVLVLIKVPRQIPQHAKTRRHYHPLLTVQPVTLAGCQFVAVYGFVRDFDLCVPATIPEERLLVECRVQ